MKCLHKLEHVVLNFLKLMTALEWQAVFAGRWNEQDGDGFARATPTPKCNR